MSDLKGYMVTVPKENRVFGKVFGIVNTWLQPFRVQRLKKRIYRKPSLKKCITENYLKF